MELCGQIHKYKNTPLLDFNCSYFVKTKTKYISEYKRSKEVFPPKKASI